MGFTGRKSSPTTFQVTSDPVPTRCSITVGHKFANAAHVSGGYQIRPSSTSGSPLLSHVERRHKRLHLLRGSVDRQHIR